MIDLITALLDTFATTVHAQSPCFGIECDASSNPLPVFITVAAALLLEVASGLSVVFVVIGGAFLVTNAGNDSQVDKGKKAIFYALLGYSIALMSQAIISFVVARASLVATDLPHLSLMQVTVNSILFIFNVVFALVMIFYGYKLVIARGEQNEFDSARKGLLWSVVGAVAINLAYALVNATELLGF